MVGSRGFDVGARRSRGDGSSRADASSSTHVGRAGSTVRRARHARGAGSARCGMPIRDRRGTHRLIEAARCRLLVESDVAAGPVLPAGTASRLVMRSPQSFADTDFERSSRSTRPRSAVMPIPDRRPESCRRDRDGRGAGGRSSPDRGARAARRARRLLPPARDARRSAAQARARRGGARLLPTCSGCRPLRGGAAVSSRQDPRALLW